MPIEKMRFNLSLLDKKGEVKKELNDLDIYEVENALTIVDNDLYDSHIEFKNIVDENKELKLVKKK